MCYVVDVKIGKEPGVLGYCCKMNVGSGVVLAPPAKRDVINISCLILTEVLHGIVVRGCILECNYTFSCLTWLEGNEG